MNYVTQWNEKRKCWHMVPVTREGARLKQFFIIALLACLVLFEAFQSVAIMENRARLDALEAPPEIVYPDIAIDTTVPHIPAMYVRHKTSLKYKTRWIYAAHNGEVRNDNR